MRNIGNTPQYTITPPVALVLCDNPSNWTDAFAALQRSCTRLHNRTAWQTQRFHMKITCIPYTVYHTIWYPTANHNWGATCLGEDTHSAMMRHPDANHNASRSHQHVFFNVFVGPSFQPQHSKLKTHAHTHLLRNILSNYCCGVHRACTNNPLKSDRKNWMTWRENQCRRILSLSLQKATVPSDEVSSKSDCENRTVDWNLLTSKFWGRSWCNWKTTCRFLA